MGLSGSKLQVDRNYEGVGEGYLYRPNSNKDIPRSSQTLPREILYLFLVAILCISLIESFAHFSVLSHSNWTS